MRFPETVNGLPILAPNELSMWLGVLFDSYRTPLSDNATMGYTVALADLTARELDLAFSESLRRHRSNFPPTPAEVRGYMEAALQRMPARPSAANPECPRCSGTGFVTVEQNGNKFAVSCQCLKKAG